MNRKVTTVLEFIITFTILGMILFNYYSKSNYNDEKCDISDREIKYYSEFKSIEDIEDYYNPPHFRCLGGWGTSAFRYCVNNKRNQMENDIEKWKELKEKGLLK